VPNNEQPADPPQKKLTPSHKLTSCAIFMFNDAILKVISRCLKEEYIFSPFLQFMSAHGRQDRSKMGGFCKMGGFSISALIKQKNASKNKRHFLIS
jgi:hypothetical protein